MQLGVAAAEVEPVADGQLGGVQRAEEDELGAARAQQREVVGVVEGEGVVPGDGDARAACRGAAPAAAAAAAAAPAPSGAAPASASSRSTSTCSSTQLAEAVHHRGHLGAELVGDHEAEVTRRQLQVVGGGQVAEHLHAGALEARPPRPPWSGAGSSG